MPLVESHASQTDVASVLGQPQSPMMRDEAKKTIHQFNPGVTAPELDALTCDSAFFYAIDPDNTLVVCFDSSGKAVKAYFGGQ